MPWYGNARHPATNQAVPDPHGPVVGGNTSVQAVVTYGPSRQAIAHARGLGLAVNTASPMSTGGGRARVWSGDAASGVNRFSGLRPAPNGSPVQGAVAPVGDPTAVRLGMQSGPSQAPGYPSTGTDGTLGAWGAVAALDMGRLSSLGWGS